MATIGRVDYEMGHAGYVYQTVLDALPTDDAIEIRDLWAIYDDLDFAERSIPLEKVLDDLSNAGHLEKRVIGPTTYIRRTRWLSSAETASRLDVSRRTVQSWHQEGRLPGVRRGGRLLFKEADVDTYVQGAGMTTVALSGADDSVLNDLWDNDADAAYDDL